MRIRADPDLHNNLQLVQVLKNMTKYVQKSLFLDAGSGFGSTSMRIRIQEASHNADPCGSGSATLLSRAMIPVGIYLTNFFWVILVILSLENCLLITFCTNAIFRTRSRSRSWSRSRSRHLRCPEPEPGFQKIIRLRQHWLLQSTDRQSIATVYQHHKFFLKNGDCVKSSAERRQTKGSHSNQQVSIFYFLFI